MFAAALEELGCSGGSCDFGSLDIFSPYMDEVGQFSLNPTDEIVNLFTLSIEAVDGRVYGGGGGGGELLNLVATSEL